MLLLKEDMLLPFGRLLQRKQEPLLFGPTANIIRERNIVLRLDCIFADERLMHKVYDPVIHGLVMGSDHCQIAIKL